MTEAAGGITASGSELGAIMFADIFEYGRLVAENEYSALRHVDTCLNAFRTHCDAFEGNFIKTTGDGAVVLFKSALSAVNYSLHMHREIAELNKDLSEHEIAIFRIGVHLGEVHHGPGDIYGNAVNIAARLQEIAEPGGICLSKIAYDQVKSRLKVGFESIGEQQLKNLPEPVAIYRVREGMSAATRVP